MTAVNLNGATVNDGAGNAANLSLTGLTQTGPQIDTTTRGDLVDYGDTLKRRPQRRQGGHADTVGMSEAVTVRRHADAGA